MKGKHLVIGLVLFVVAIIVAIYFAMMAEFNKDEQGMDSVVTVVEVLNQIEYR